MSDALRLWGWFDDATQKEPTYEPPRDAPCPYCFAPVTADDVRTHSLMLAGPVYAKRSYFYRTHRTCDEAAGRSEAQDGRDLAGMDGRILDAITKVGD